MQSFGKALFSVSSRRIGILGSNWEPGRLIIFLERLQEVITRYLIFRLLTGNKLLAAFLYYKTAWSVAVKGTPDEMYSRNSELTL
jgi:hypothetical protein